MKNLPSEVTSCQQPHRGVRRLMTECSVGLWMLALLLSSGLAAEEVDKKEKKMAIKEKEVVADEETQTYLKAVSRIVKTETQFLKQVCQLSPEEMAQLKKDTTEISRAVARSFVAAQKKNQNKWPNPRTATGSEMLAWVEKNLPQEKRDIYRQEVDHRTESLRLAMIQGMMLTIDRKLLLSEEQAKKLETGLLSNWRPQHENLLLLFAYGEQYAPRPGNEIVLPLLNEEQKAIWISLGPTHEIGFGWEQSFGIFGIDVPEADEVQPVAEPIPKAN